MTWTRLSSPTGESAMSVVGSRRASKRSLDWASEASTALVSAGITVVSGLAAGIDTAAHTAALDTGERTVAVLDQRRPIGDGPRAGGCGGRRLPAQCGATFRRAMYCAVSVLRSRRFRGRRRRCTIVPAGLLPRSTTSATAGASASPATTIAPGTTIAGLRASSRNVQTRPVSSSS
ncbi:MAG: DNA-processing protein DprA [Pseudonocardiales bacterium]|nr:DNA-processing protein DprA [Pseudonocardiales bacterium]